MLTFDSPVVEQLINTANIMMREHLDRNRRLGNMRSYNLLVAELARQGYELLGNGHFAAVFTHPNIEGVVKLGFKKEDSGAAYAAFCRSHKGVKHLPEIYDIKRFKSFYAVLMPQYMPIETGYQYGWPLDELEKEHLIHARRALSNGADRGCHDVFKSIVKTASLIGGHFRGVASFDLHSDNMMKRSDGTMIITDPVSFTAEDYEEEKEESWIMDDLRVYHLLNDLNKLPVRKVIERTAPHLKGCKKPKFLIAMQERMRFKRR